jgi:hypothetical protein
VILASKVQLQMAAILLLAMVCKQQAVKLQHLILLKAQL